MLKKIMVVVLLAVALMGAADIVNGFVGERSVAEAAARGAAQGKKVSPKTKKTNAKKPATTTSVAKKVVSLESPAQLDGVAASGKWEHFPAHGCYKFVLGQTITVSDKITLIVVKTGKTAQTNSTVKKGTSVKVFFKTSTVETVKQPQEKQEKKVASKEQTASSKDEAKPTTEVRKTEVVRPQIIANTRYMLEFAHTADYEANVVPAGQIQGEADLCLIGKTFIRNSLCQSQFLALNVDRSFIVTDDMIVTVFDKKGRSADMETGQRVAKNVSAKIMFRHPTSLTRFETPQVAETPAQETTAPVYTAQVSTPAPVAPVSDSYSGDYAGTMAELANFGKGVKEYPVYTDIKEVTQEFTLNPAFTARSRTKDGRWITIQPDESGKLVISEGIRNLRVYKNAPKNLNTNANS